MGVTVFTGWTEKTYRCAKGHEETTAHPLTVSFTQADTQGTVKTGPLCRVCMTAALDGTFGMVEK